MTDPTASEILDGGPEGTPVIDVEATPQKSGKALTIGLTVGFMAASIVLSTIFEEDIAYFGDNLLHHYGRDWLDVILIGVSTVSMPFVLPIWPYELVGIKMGFSIERLSLVMAIGSATGSLAILYMGRYFGKTAWVRRRFPNIEHHPWTEGKSRTYVTLLLFLGTASPIPVEVFYAAAGAKRYPAFLFWLIMIPGRFIRYWYTGYWLYFFGNVVDKVI